MKYKQRGGSSSIDYVYLSLALSVVTSNNRNTWYGYVLGLLCQVELLCDENVLHKDNTLKFIWISHWLKRDPPMVLHYRLKRRLG